MGWSCNPWAWACWFAEEKNTWLGFGKIYRFGLGPRDYWVVFLWFGSRPRQTLSYPCLLLEMERKPYCSAHTVVRWWGDKGGPARFSSGQMGVQVQLMGSMVARFQASAGSDRKPRDGVGGQILINHIWGRLLPLIHELTMGYIGSCKTGSTSQFLTQ